MPRAIDSVLAQQGIGALPLEVIVVDDGSTDQTRALMEREYPDVTYVAQANLGVSAARNAGLKLADGEWIALLDSDDEWLPHKLATQIPMIEQTSLLICHTEEVWIRNGVRVNQMKKHQKYGGDIFAHCLPLCAMSPSSILIHREVFDVVGVFDESLPACEDYDLWLRIAARYSVAYVETPCINKFGGHADQLSRQHWGMDRFRVIALQNLLNQPVERSGLSQANRSAALAMLLKKLTILQLGASKHNNTQLLEYCQQALAQWSPNANTP